MERPRSFYNQKRAFAPENGSEALGLCDGKLEPGLEPCRGALFLVPSHGKLVSAITRPCLELLATPTASWA